MTAAQNCDSDYWQQSFRVQSLQLNVIASWFPDVFQVELLTTVTHCYIRFMYGGDNQETWILQKDTSEVEHVS